MGTQDRMLVNGNMDRSLRVLFGGLIMFHFDPSCDTIHVSQSLCSAQAFTFGRRGSDGC